MKLPRLKSIDTFRGLCMSWMILAHLSGWWIRQEDFWVAILINVILDPIGASGFLFIAGVSIMLSYRKKLNKAKDSEHYSKKMIRNEYFLRAFFILIVALTYNLSIAITLNNFTWVWSWFILLTTSISFILAWPLLKISKLLRLAVSVAIWVANGFIFNSLILFEGQFNPLGVMFYILYNGYSLDPILPFFPFFLIGTVVGDIIFEIFSKTNLENRKKIFKINLFTPSIIIGASLILFNIFFQFPVFLERRSLPWLLYTVGIDLVLFLVLLTFEIYGFMEKKKSYRFLFYYSFYSLTIYLGHNLLYFLFLNQLNLFNIWFFIAGAFIAIGLLLRFIYKRWSEKASLKYHLSRLSISLARRIESKSVIRENSKLNTQ
ncbi:MAG: heparan-alpha-glucosaminide N-acetyltransferase domain-containing protein [Promethearchaeota archaeon]